MSADYINIENITFKGNSNGGSTLIYLSYGTNHLSIQNNVFILDSNSYGCQAIYLTQNTIKSEYINISNNTFIGGDDHIYISAIHTAKDAQEFVIQNNYFRKANNHGIRINRTDSCLIQNNTFEDRCKTNYSIMFKFSSFFFVFFS
jgi:parallel beta-helix repeat protein